MPMSASTTVRTIMSRYVLSSLGITRKDFIIRSHVPPLNISSPALSLCLSFIEVFKIHLYTLIHADTHTNTYVHTTYIHICPSVVICACM